MNDADSPMDFNPEDSLKLVRAALSPHESEYLKLTTGKESPDLIDYFKSTGQFTRAREERDMIRQAVMMEGLKLNAQRRQAPTQEEANTAFPGFPIAPSSKQMVPQAPLQSPEMPVLQGTQQTQIPDNRFQGPMPGVMTPLGEQAKSEFFMGNKPPAGVDPTRYLAGKPEFIQEGPRPLRTITTGEYGPDTAPSQSMEVNPKAKLPPSFQALYNAKVHQESLRQPGQAHHPSAEESKYTDAVKYGIMAWSEDHPGQTPTAKDMLMIQQQAAGAFEKPPMPGTAGADKLRGEADITKKKAEGFEKRENKELGKMDSETAHLDAQTKDSNALRDAKLNELIARTSLHRMQGNVAAAKAEMAAFSELLRLDERTWKTFQSIMLTGDIDDESKRAVLKPLLERSAELAVSPADPGVIDQLLGRETGTGIKIRPSGVQPYQWTNPSGKSGITGIVDTPVSPEAPVEPKQDDTAALRSLGMSMKDGEVKSYKGQKYRRKGGKLEKVQ